MSLIMKFRQISALQYLGLPLQHLSRTSSTFSSLEYDRDPKPLFVDAETQSLLRSMTQCHINKVFHKTAIANNSMAYKFMTTEQLEEEFQNTIKKAHELLQMPPVVMVKEDKQTVISEDAALKDFSDSKFVITDITYGLRQSERKVVVRETDGTLRYAPLEVAKRMNQLYFPLNGRKIRTPRMFEDEHLKNCLDEHKYEFVLDRMTLQYEPYEKDYHRITSIVYQHLNESKQFDMLRSTRHFGPMAFFYAWHRCIDDLLYDMIQRDYLRNGVELIALMYKIHSIQNEYGDTLQKVSKLLESRNPALEELKKSLPKSSMNDDIHEEIQTAIGKTKEDFEADDLCMKFIDDYIGKHALKKVQLELAMQSLKETNAEKKLLFDGLNKAHGVQS